MNGIVTDGIVLRHADYRDSDRMVTLLTPQYGRMDAIARGCRKNKSALLNASELFCAGEFEIHRRGNRYAIEQCQIKDGFYELRLSYERLAGATYLAALSEGVAVQDQPAPELFLLLVRALAHMTYAELPPELITAMFEMHFMRVTGFLPHMSSCARCAGALDDGEAFFSPRAGGAVCARCRENAMLMSDMARRILTKAPRAPFDSVSLLADQPAWREAAHLIRPFVLERVERGVRYAPPLPPRQMDDEPSSQKKT